MKIVTNGWSFASGRQFSSFMRSVEAYRHLCIQRRHGCQESSSEEEHLRLH